MESTGWLGRSSSRGGCSTYLSSIVGSGRWGSNVLAPLLLFLPRSLLREGRSFPKAPEAARKLLLWHLKDTEAARPAALRCLS